MKSKKRKPNKKRNPSKKTKQRKIQRNRNRAKRRIAKRGRISQIRRIPLTPSAADLQRRVFRALRRMREGDSLSKATREEKLKRDTFIRHARPALRRNGPGKPWKAIPEDKLDSVMNVLTEFGPVAVIVRSSKERKLLGRHNRAVRMLRAGEEGAETALQEFDGKKVAGHVLITDVKILVRLEEAGRLDFDDLYSSLGEES